MTPLLVGCNSLSQFSNISPPPNQYEPNDWQKFHPLLNAKLFIYMTHSDIHYSAVDVK